MGESTTGQSDVSAGPELSTSPQTPRSTMKARKWLPAVIAVLFFTAFSAVVLSQPEKMIEPDPYAYRASISALEDGNLTLTGDQYNDLASRLQESSLGGGIMQWHQNDDGSWVSEKNPGYPFLAIGFDEVGALRLAPLFYGALACLALWFGARRWLGRWGGTFAVGAYCSTALAMVMAWRSTMPTFTDASLVAVGIGLLIWSVVALDRSRRARTIVGAIAFFSFGLAVFVRYTNVVVLAVAAVFALAVCLRPKWNIRWSTLLWWAIASLPPLFASVIYNAAVFDGPFSTGYNASTVQFSINAIPDNLRLMPSRLWQAMPIFVLGLAAILVLIAIQIITALRSRSRPEFTIDSTTDDVDIDGSGSNEFTHPVGESSLAEHDAMSRSTIDRWIGSFLVLAWAATWATYAAYEWTANLGGGPPGGGGAGRAGGPGGAMAGMTQPVYSSVRFYLPALGAIALLVAWLFTRMPAVIGVVALVALFAFGAHEFIDTTTSQWASMSMGGGRGSLIGPGGGNGQGGPGGMPQFDPSKCPNLPQLPGTGANPGGGSPDGQRPAPGGTPGTPPDGLTGRGGLTFDANGCPVMPGGTNSGVPTPSTTINSPTATGSASA